MLGLGAIQESHDHTGIQQYGPQRPKPRRCFLLEPRSGIPEENLPSPTILRLLGWEAAKRRIPSRTTMEGLKPSRSTKHASVFSVSASSLA
jgi:hypothetical protein